MNTTPVPKTILFPLQYFGALNGEDMGFCDKRPIINTIYLIQ